MNRLIIFLCSLMSFITVSKAQDNGFSLEEIENVGLKVVHINTVDNEEPICNYIEAPKGSMGMSITDATKVPCQIIITQHNDTLYDSGQYEESVSGATIKIVGNTTAYFSVDENKPYKIKLQKKKDLLFRDDEHYADKEWRLLKDAVSLNTIIGLKVSELLNFPWTPAYTPCNVFLNGDYQGCYLLMESVKRNANCRLNVNQQTGYIIERDPYWWNEDTYFTSDFFSINNAYRWTWKYPNEDKVTEEQETYIKQFINQAEQSIIDGNYEAYIDVESFARWVLAQDILGIYDSGGTNLYVTKYDNTPSSLLQMPVLWDFDSNFSMEAGQFSRIHDASYDYYFHNLFNNHNQQLTDTYKTVWNRVRSTLLEDITVFISNFIQSEEGKALHQSSQLNIKRWNYDEFPTLQEFATEAINWFETHLPLLDQRISQLDETSIIHATVDSKAESLYNLYGQRITEKPSMHKGIYIQRGRKYIIK